MPPIYSAIKVNGKKLYEYARKGEEVKIEPRNVSIFKLEIVNFDEKEQKLELYIECSKGTYIRSIAHDIGETLGCYGHLTKLVRTKAGKFRVENSIKLDSIETIEQAKTNLISPLECLNLPVYEVSESEKEKVSHGMKINANLNDGKAILTYQNNLIAVVEVKQNQAKTLKVFI